MTKHSALLAAVLAVVLRAGVPDVTGEWTVVARLAPTRGGKGAEQRIELVCTFEQHDARLTGSCRPPNGPDGAPVSGTAEGTKVEWSFDIAPNPAAKKQPATFRGTVGGGGSVMNGGLEFGQSRGDFRAKKQ